MQYDDLYAQAGRTAYDKAISLTSDLPRRRLLKFSIFDRLVKEQPNTLTSGEHLPDQIECHWVISGHWKVYLKGVAPQQGITQSISLQAILKTKARVTIYIDGSVTGGTVAGDTVMEFTVGVSFYHTMNSFREGGHIQVTSDALLTSH